MKSAGFDNRELSWLKFNGRVLEEAEDESLPLLERLFFLSVFQKNQDEFFMVRAGFLLDQMSVSEKIRENKTGMTAREQLLAIFKQVRKLDDRRSTVWTELTKSLAEEKFYIVDFPDLTEDEIRFLLEYFKREIMPILSPQIVGKRQPFPFLINGGIYAVLNLETRNANNKIGLIPCFSSFFQRLILLPGQDRRYILIENVIRHYAPMVFENYRVRDRALLRVTRNADMVQELADEWEDYRDYMEEVVRKRRRRRPVRLEISQQLPAFVLARLCGWMELERDQVFLCRTPMDLSFVQEIRHILRDRGELFYERRTPGNALTTGRIESIWRQAWQQDHLLFYPYESMKPFLRMLEEAAADPDVISIKMTLYRLARGSKIIDLLIEAAENGKDVMALLELGARFDEENNIECSRRLEEAGCRILYGLDGLKVHSKLCLITAKKEGEISYLTQIGTGNYNEKTARQYSDLSYMTVDRKIGTEVNRIFHFLSLGQPPDGCEKLLVAPAALQTGILRLIREQTQNARQGHSSYIGMKMNSLTDISIIDALMEASAAGVRIDLIVRSSCCVVGGIPEKTENIHVTSIVGRFLEHSRMYLFGTGKEQRIYIGSADMMTRNTMHRVEVLTPIESENCRERLREIFSLQLADNENSRVQLPDGSYIRKRPAQGEAHFDSQEYFYRFYSQEN